MFYTFKIGKINLYMANNIMCLITLIDNNFYALFGWFVYSDLINPFYLNYFYKTTKTAKKKRKKKTP